MTETATQQLVHALFTQEPRHLGLSFLDPDEGGVSLVRTAADTACYRVFAESIQAAPYVTIDGAPWEEYEQGLSSRLRQDARRHRRRLEEGRVTLDIHDGTER